MALRQEILKEYDSPINIARSYYTFLLMINNISISNMEMNLLCFCAIRGNISTKPAINEFLTEFKSTINNFYNMKSHLQKKNLLYRVQSKTIVNPAIALDFSKSPVTISLTLKLKDEQPTG